MQFFIENTDWVLALISALLLVFSLIAEKTKTNKDDKIVEKLKKFFRKVN